MTRRAFWLVAAAYACLAFGAIVSFYLLHRTQSEIDQNAHRLNVAIAVDCEVSLAPDAMEPEVLRRLATATNGNVHRLIHDPICLTIYARVNHGYPK